MWQKQKNMKNGNYTISFEVAQIISKKSYFPLNWVLENGVYYLTSSNKKNTSEYFAELLAERAVNNDDMSYQENIANIVGLLPMFKAKVYSMLEAI